MLGYGLYRSEEDVGKMIKENGITVIVDIRSTLGSRNRTFDESRYGSITKLCTELGIRYDASFHVTLGGRQNGQEKMTIGNFREYTKTRKYAEEITRLEQLVAGENGGNVLLICCERDIKTCHRKVIGETFLNKGWDVVDL